MIVPFSRQKRGSVAPFVAVSVTGSALNQRTPPRKPPQTAPGQPPATIGATGAAWRRLWRFPLLISGNRHKRRRIVLRKHL